MKRLSHLTLLILACVPCSVPGNEAWVRQTDLTNGIVYDIPLQSTGGPFTAQLPISEAGSMFELFARGTAWDENIYLLDTVLMRAYAPAVKVEITTEDSYLRGEVGGFNYVRRTRADRPFSVQIEVTGLVPGSSNPAEREVYLACRGKAYDINSYSGLSETQFMLEEANLDNGTVTLGPAYHQLPCSAVSQGCGEHEYTFVRYASDGVPDTILAQPKIEVWPVATAELENITEGSVIIDRIPTVVVKLKSLYPDSRTYAHIYPGPAVLGTNGTLINGSERRFGAYYNPGTSAELTNVPQTLEISMEDLSNYAPKDGIYTLEIITETPFFGRAQERLAVVSFEVDRDISSRGQLSTSEGQGP